MVIRRLPGLLSAYTFAAGLAELTRSGPIAAESAVQGERKGAACLPLSDLDLGNPLLHRAGGTASRVR